MAELQSAERDKSQRVRTFGRPADYKSAIGHSAAKPQPKERGVYAASTLEVLQVVKRGESLENPKAEAA